MEQLSYGYRKPEDGDSGTQFFEDMKQNIQKLNDHTHDGEDSYLIPTHSLEKQVQTHAGNTFSSSGLRYRKLITVPTDYDFDLSSMTFYADSKVFTPSIERVSDTTFYLYIPVTTYTVTILYV